MTIDCRQVAMRFQGVQLDSENDCAEAILNRKNSNKQKFYIGNGGHLALLARDGWSDVGSGLPSLGQCLGSGWTALYIEKID